MLNITDTILFQHTLCHSFIPPFSHTTSHGKQWMFYWWRILRQKWFDLRIQIVHVAQVCDFACSALNEVIWQTIFTAGKIGQSSGRLPTIFKKKKKELATFLVEEVEIKSDCLEKDLSSNLWDWVHTSVPPCPCGMYHVFGNGHKTCLLHCHQTQIWGHR